MDPDIDTPPVELPKTPVLITAATKWEAEPLAKALGLKRISPTRWEGVISGRSLTLLKTGIGAKNTADALAPNKPQDFGLTISAGLCGAMQKEAKTGHLVVDAREVDLDFVKPLRETAIKLTVPFHFGKILHTNIVLKPAVKKSLGEEQRALACDMETAAVRRWSEKTPTIGVRVVLDELHEEIPGDAPEGEDPVSLAKYALTHAADLPRLINTGMRSGRAMKTLSLFLKTYLETI